MTQSDRIAVINECIRYLKERKGRNAIKCLLTLRDNLPEPEKVSKPAKEHPWRAAA